MSVYLNFSQHCYVCGTDVQFMGGERLDGPCDHELPGVEIDGCEDQS